MYGSCLTGLYGVRSRVLEHQASHILFTGPKKKASRTTEPQRHGRLSVCGLSRAWKRVRGEDPMDGIVVWVVPGFDQGAQGCVFRRLGSSLKLAGWLCELSRSSDDRQGRSAI